MDGQLRYDIYFQRLLFKTFSAQHIKGQTAIQNIPPILYVLELKITKKFILCHEYETIYGKMLLRLLKGRPKEMGIS